MFQKHISWRAVMALALTSIWIERCYVWGWFSPENFWPLLFSFLQLVCIGASLHKRFSQWALILFWVVFLLDRVPDFAYQANHTWLAMWALLPAAFFFSWWNQGMYHHYVRFTLAWVLLLSSIQKLVAGTFLDGTYLSYLGFYGEMTERFFLFLCPNPFGIPEVCPIHVYLRLGIVLWQFLVSFFLFLNLRGRWIILLEVGFLVGAGLFADELNFQTLVLLLLAIVFQWRPVFWMVPVVLGVLVLDYIKINDILLLF